MTDKVICPIGFMQGTPMPLNEALYFVATEMFGQRSDLREFSPNEIWTHTYYLCTRLERYSIAIFLIIAQNENDDVDLSELIALAKKHGLSVPQELEKAQS
jgi:hypothetical protein